MTDIKKNKFLIDNFKISEELLIKILDISESLGTSKYNVWIAKEAKKNENILNFDKLRFIIDWAQLVKPNIFSLNFEQAFTESEKWHNSRKQNLKKANKRYSDNSRIVYRCSDGEHFFLKLKPEELYLEGELMGNCVGGYSYIRSLKKKEIIILSLRDKNNFPHVTIEICNKTGREIQTQGKCNTVPIKKYQILIAEFALYAINPDEEELDPEILQLLKIKLQ